MKIIDDILILKKVIDKAFIRISKEAQLTLNELRVLLFLYENDKFDLASEIVQELMISKAHVSVSIDELVKKKYLKRISDENDKKKNHLKLTNKASKILEQIDVETNHLKQELLKNISNEDMETFKHTIKTIIQNTKDFVDAKREEEQL